MPLSQEDYEKHIQELETELANAEAEIASEGESVKFRSVSEIKSSLRYFKEQLAKLSQASNQRGKHRAFRVRGCRGL